MQEVWTAILNLKIIYRSAANQTIAILRKKQINHSVQLSWLRYNASDLHSGGFDDITYLGWGVLSFIRCLKTDAGVVP
jgi:hypothetical protein